jgi:hypothetical protein
MALLLLSYLGFFLAGSGAGGRHANEAGDRAASEMPPVALWRWIMDRFIPETENRLHRWVCQGWLATALAALNAWLCFVVFFPMQWMPSPQNLLLITGGSFLIGAALSVAWAEKRLFSESAYQYNTMAALFLHARQHLAVDLAKLEACGESSNEFDEVVERVQAFLYALGKEALDENAEWLLLHRARPLEPVMPG